MAIGIPGADELVGKGVYRGLPPEIPQPVRDRRAIVAGAAAECAVLARGLREAGWTVSVAVPHQCGGRACTCRRKTGSELVCVAGVNHLEVVLLRRTDTGRIEARHAAALFIL